MYEQIGLTIPDDFYDAAHVNINGSVKFTNFLSEYLCNEFALPDRRGQEDYASWEKAYEEYAAYVTGVIGRMPE